MKRIGNLTEKWCNFDSLLEAFFQVKKGKSYFNEVVKYEMNLVSNLSLLLESLINGTYRPKPLRVFNIYIPKLRKIQAPAFEDRIVHHAIMNVIEPIIDKRLIFSTFACRKNKGVLSANNALTKYLKDSNNKYYLKLDIEKFFYSIDHDSLLKELRRIIKDEKTINTLALFFGGDKGLPLGNVTSQLMANLALNNLDHFIKRQLKCKFYVRYMDDMIILGQSINSLKSIWDLIKTKINEIKLNLNSKSHIGLVGKGVDFVGFKTWANKRIIRKSTLFTVGRKIKKFHRWDIANSYLAHAKYTCSIKYVADIIANKCPALIPDINHWLKNNEVNYVLL